mgnify:CR=1 FL=1
MQGIIIAAGMGNRMGLLTRNKPKCLLPIKEKTLLEFAIKGLKYAGCQNIIIITGYKAKYIQQLGYETIYNKNYRKNNILHSFFSALPILNIDTMVSYSDIYVEKNIYKDLSKKKDDIVLTIDKDWKNYYKNRKMHPVSQAEKVFLDKSNKIKEIGKNLNLNYKKKCYEFTGLFKLSKNGCKIISKVFRMLDSKYKKNQPFENSDSWEKAYLTDFFHYIIKNDITKIYPHVISKGWAEFDTIEDYNRLNTIKEKQGLISL